MACERIARMLPDWVSGGLSDRQAAKVRRHLQGCAECSAEAERLRAADQALRAALAPPEPPLSLWEGVAARIDAEPASQRPRPGFRLVPAVAGLAATAALLLAVTQAPRQTPEPVGPTQETYAVRHVMSSWHDPLADQAALGALAGVVRETPEGGR